MSGIGLLLVCSGPGGGRLDVGDTHHAGGRVIVLVVDERNVKTFTGTEAIEVDVRRTICAHSAALPMSGGVEHLVVSVYWWSIAAAAKSLHLDAVRTRFGLGPPILVSS